MTHAEDLSVTWCVGLDQTSCVCKHREEKVHEGEVSDSKTVTMDLSCLYLQPEGRLIILYNAFALSSRTVDLTGRFHGSV